MTVLACMDREGIVMVVPGPFDRSPDIYLPHADHYHTAFTRPPPLQNRRGNAYTHGSGTVLTRTFRSSLLSLQEKNPELGRNSSYNPWSPSPAHGFKSPSFTCTWYTRNHPKSEAPPYISIIQSPSQKKRKEKNLIIYPQVGAGGIKQTNK